MRIIKLASCSLVVALSLGVGSPGGAQQRFPSNIPVQFNRAWFKDAPQSEINGFLDGYYDCLPNPKARALAGWSLPTESMIEKIGDFYRRHPTSHLNVPQVATRIAANTSAPHRASGGEVYTNRHRYYDYLWWQTTDLEQLGYVEGYLFCLGRSSTKSQARGLANAITAWYKKHQSKEDRPIALVLQEFLKGQNQASGVRQKK